MSVATTILNRKAAVPTEQAIDQPVFGRRNLIAAVLLFVGAQLSFFALQGLAHIDIVGVSHAPHYIWQSWSFLHGHLAIDLYPQAADIIEVHGKHYIVYPPLPPIIMMPFVAIWGLKASDILFTSIVGALNLPLLYLLFEQARAANLTRRPWLHNLTLAVLLFFGSIHLWLAIGGKMWFTGHIMCFTFTVLALLLALRRRYGWSGVALACAFFCRGPVALGFPFLIYLAWQDVNREQLVERFVAGLRARRIDWEAIPWSRVIPPFAAAVVMVALFLVRNALFFGSPFETGYNLLIHQRYPQVTQGVFNVAYVPANIIANFFSFPLVTFTNAYDRHPLLNIYNDGFCVSVFVTTPLFLLLFWRNSQRSLLRFVLGATVVLSVAVVLCFHAAGWYQFGARYLFDAYPFAMLFLAISEVRFDWRVVALGLIGIAINVMGAYEVWTNVLLHL